MNTLRRLTSAQEGQIQLFSAIGRKQKSIAKQLHLSVHLVRKVQREHGLLPHSTDPLPPEIEQQITKLFQQGHGAPFICAKLAVGQHRVYQVLRERSLKRRLGVGHRYNLSTADKRDIRRAFRIFETALAKRYGVTRSWISRFRQNFWKGEE
jgi:hypothetical protein